MKPVSVSICISADWQLISASVNNEHVSTVHGIVEEFVDKNIACKEFPHVVALQETVGAFSNGRSWLHHAGLTALFQPTSLRDVKRSWVGHERCTAAVLCVQDPFDVWREVILLDSQTHSAQYLRGSFSGVVMPRHTS